MRTSICTLAAALLAAPAWTPAAASGTCGATPNVEAVGSGSSGTLGTPSLRGLGVPVAGEPGSFRFQVTGGLPFSAGALLLSRRERPAYSPIFDTTIYTGPFVVAVPFFLDQTGSATIAPGRTTMAHQALCGLDLISQAFVIDPGATGFAAWTNALRFRFGEEQERLLGIGLSISTAQSEVLSIDPGTGAGSVLGALPPELGIIRDLDLSADGATLYVASVLPADLHVLDATTLELQATIPVGGLGLDALEREDAGTLLAVHSANLIRIHPFTGSVELIGPLSQVPVASLTRAPGGGLYGLVTPFVGVTSLVEIDPATGATLSSVALSLPEPAIALEIAPDGRFLAIDAFGNLSEVDPATGAGTAVGPLGLPDIVYGLASPP